MLRMRSRICRKSRSSKLYDHIVARVASSQRPRLSARKRSRRRARGVVDTSVLLAGVAGTLGHNASANFVKRWVNTFVWLISKQILNEHEEILARHKVRRPTSPPFERLPPIQKTRQLAATIASATLPLLPQTRSISLCC